MSKYEEITEAFGKFYDATIPVRDELRDIASSLLNYLRQLGEIPEEKCGLAPASGELDEANPARIEDAITFDDDEECWLIHYYIEVRRQKDLGPTEYFGIIIEVTRNGGKYSLKLKAPKGKESDVVDWNQGEQAIRDFVQKLLDGIVEYYSALASQPGRIQAKDYKRITGFTR
jgi:hypothetical protein